MDKVWYLDGLIQEKATRIFFDQGIFSQGSGNIFSKIKKEKKENVRSKKVIIGPNDPPLSDPKLNKNNTWRHA